MAYTVDQSSGTGVQGAYDEIFYVVRDTTNYNAPKFRYLLKVTIDGTVVGTFKQLPNNNDCAVFLIEQIVAPFVHQDENIWQIGSVTPSGGAGSTKPFAVNEDAIKTVLVDFGYEKAVDANSAPAETWGAAAQTSFKAVNGSLRPNTSASYAPNYAINYGMSGVGGEFLSTTLENYVVEDQWGALAFLNGDDVGSDDCNYFHVTFYTAAGGAINTGYFENSTTYGGYTPAAGLNDERSLIYLGCFPGNLQQQGIDTNIRPSNNTNWAYYEVQAASSTTLSGNEASVAYKFHKMCDTRYNRVLGNNKFVGEYYVCWWNNLGGVDNLVFDGASQVMEQIKRETYYSIGGNAFNAGNTVDYNKRASEGGTTSSGNQTTTSITLNTREQNPEDLNYLMQSLANSPRVYVFTRAFLTTGIQAAKSSAFVRCVVTDMSLSYKTAINDKVANYSVTIQISRRIPNNQ